MYVILRSILKCALSSSFYRSTPVPQWAHNRIQGHENDLPSTPFRNFIQQHITGSGLKSGARRILVTVAKEEAFRDKEKQHAPAAQAVVSPSRAHRERGNYMKPTEAFRLVDLPVNQLSRSMKI